jgi:hypothetical protein
MEKLSKCPFTFSKSMEKLSEWSVTFSEGSTASDRA